MHKNLAVANRNPQLYLHSGYKGDDLLQHARRVSFQIKLKLINLKRNLSFKT